MDEKIRLGMIEICKEGIRQLKGNLEESKKMEKSFEEFMRNQGSEEMKLSVYKSFLNPIKSKNYDLNQEIKMH